MTVVLAYLMRTLGWTLSRSYSYVQRRRPTVSPNLGFMGHLTEFETVLRHVGGGVGDCITGGLSLPTAAFPATATAVLDHLPATAPIAMAQRNGGRAFAAADILAATSAWSLQCQALGLPPTTAMVPAPLRERAASRGSAGSNPFESAMVTATATTVHGA